MLPRRTHAKLGCAVFVAFLLAVSPILSLLAAFGAADVLGCQVGSNDIRPCVVLGVDIGTMLSTMTYAAFLGFFTVPIFGIVALGLSVAWVVAALRMRRETLP